MSVSGTIAKLRRWCRSRLMTKASYLVCLESEANWRFLADQHMERLEVLAKEQNEILARLDHAVSDNKRLRQKLSALNTRIDSLEGDNGTLSRENGVLRDDLRDERYLHEKLKGEFEVLLARDERWAAWHAREQQRLEKEAAIEAVRKAAVIEQPPTREDILDG